VKQPSFRVKLAAVASSVLLVGAFLAYRAGAFARVLGGGRPGSASGTTTSPTDLMSSSKSGGSFHLRLAASQPATHQAAEPAADAASISRGRELMLLGGSKSAAVVVEGDLSTPPAAAEPVAQQAQQTVPPPAASD
jgi:hypothetical protein